MSDGKPGGDSYWDIFRPRVPSLPCLVTGLKRLSYYEDQVGCHENQAVANRLLWQAMGCHCYAAIQQRLISPEGTFPPIGRSLCYRFGAFHLLAETSLRRQLPEDVSPE